MRERAGLCIKHSLGTGPRGGYLRPGSRAEGVRPRAELASTGRHAGPEPETPVKNHGDIWATSLTSPMGGQGPREAEAGLPRAPSRNPRVTRESPSSLLPQDHSSPPMSSRPCYSSQEISRESIPPHEPRPHRFIPRMQPLSLPRKVHLYLNPLPRIEDIFPIDF